MTDDEKVELKTLLQDDLEIKGLKETEIIRRVYIPLDYDSGQFYITEAELTVFRISPHYAPALIHAYKAFEDAHGMVSPSHFKGRISELLAQVSSLFPKPEFRKAVLCSSHYIWIAHYLYGLPQRQAYGYFYKREMNTSVLIEFADEDGIPF